MFQIWLLKGKTCLKLKCCSSSFSKGEQWSHLPQRIYYHPHMTDNTCSKGQERNIISYTWMYKVCRGKSKHTYESWLNHGTLNYSVYTHYANKSNVYSLAPLCCRHGAAWTPQTWLIFSDEDFKALTKWIEEEWQRCKREERGEYR